MVGPEPEFLRGGWGGGGAHEKVIGVVIIPFRVKHAVLVPLRVFSF